METQFAVLTLIVWVCGLITCYLLLICGAEWHYKHGVSAGAASPLGTDKPTKNHWAYLIGQFTVMSFERLTDPREPRRRVSQHGLGVAEAVVSLGLWWTDLFWELADALTYWLQEPQSSSGKTLFPGTC